MPTLPTEQFSALHAANLDLLFSLTNQTMVGFQKLTELNLQTMKATLAETQDNLKKAFAAKDVQELLALQASLLQPAAEKAQAYRRQFVEITSATRAEFAKVAEAQYEENKRKVQDVIDNATKAAPAGSEAAVAAWQSAVSAATSLCDTVQQSARQAIEITESNLDIAAAAASNAARQATAQAARATKR
ncbi:TIGR01841 family phasin [Cupriavidus sp. NPDC089707]|uniref:TIGR01841 family phasin n=1 Tax=Cupriavidus sp. NPDC089707 TaxID=3363963 RepID=UPI003803E164